MNETPEILDACTGPDLIRTDIDSSQYMIENNIPPVRVIKKRNSVIVVHLKKQLKNGLRFVSLLCDKANRPKSGKKSLQGSVHQSLQIPYLEVAPDSQCTSLFQQEIIKIPPTPLSSSKQKTISQPFVNRATPSHYSISLRGKTPMAITKPRVKRVFNIKEKCEAYTLSLSPKLKKRALHSFTSGYSVFDTREIQNIRTAEFID